MPLRNDDIQTLIKIEHLLWEEGEKIFGKDHTKAISYNFQGDIDKITYDDFIDYYNFIDRMLQEKQRANQRVAEYHKLHPEKHRTYNREWAKKSRKKSRKTLDK